MLKLHLHLFSFPWNSSRWHTFPLRFYIRNKQPCTFLKWQRRDPRFSSICIHRIVFKTNDLVLMATSGVTDGTEVSFFFLVYITFFNCWFSFAWLIVIFIMISWKISLLYLLVIRRPFFSVLVCRFHTDHLLNRQTARGIFPSFLPTLTIQLHLIVVGTTTAPRLATAVFTIAVSVQGQRDSRCLRNVS